MDSKKVKYVFIIFVCFIIIFAIFKINSNKDKKQINETQNNSEIIYQNSINLGVSNVDTLNPLLTKNKQLIDIYQLVYEPLFSLDNEYKLQPCLATEYAKTSAMTYILKINNSIKWSDGSNLTADDVKYTVNLLKSKDNLYSDNVKNIESVEVIDNTTIKFNLNEDIYYFEYNLIFPIMCQNYYGEEDFFTTGKKYIGTGMYKIFETSDNQVILEKNENYRNQDEINKNIEKVYINIFAEIGEAYNAFKIGNIDVLSTSSVSYENYIGTMGYYAKEYRGREYDFLSFNCNDNILKEKGVRQAIGYAIDKDNIVSTVFNNKYYTSDYPLDYGSYLYQNSTPSSGFNPEKAKQILSESGWIYNNNRWRKNGKILSLTISTNSSNSQRCEVAKNIKSQLENIGISVNVLEVSDWQYNALLQNKNYQILLTGVYNSYSPDLTYFYGENNLANYKNDDVKNMINDVKNITDKKVLSEKYKSIIDMTKDDSPYVSLYRNKNTLLLNQKIVGSFEPINYGVFRNFKTWNKE